MRAPFIWPWKEDSDLTACNSCIKLCLIYACSSYGQEQDSSLDQWFTAVSLWPPPAIVCFFVVSVMNLDDLTRRGLYLSDIPLHDATRDLVLLGEQFREEYKLTQELEILTDRLQHTLRALEDEKKKTDRFDFIDVLSLFSFNLAYRHTAAYMTWQESYYKHTQHCIK